MFKDLLSRILSPEPETLPDEDARLALAALFVRLAKADNDYATIEIATIDKALAHRYGLNPVAAAKLRANAEKLEKDAPDTVRFTSAVKEVVSLEDRTLVIEALWRVVLADGVRRDEENQLMRLVAPMLGLGDRESNEIRRKVEEEG